MTDASTTGAVVTDERLIERLADMGIQCCDLAAARIPALVAERDAAMQRAEAAERAEAAAWNAAIEAAIGLAEAETSNIRAIWQPKHNEVPLRISAAIRALRRAAPTEGEAQSLDDTTRAVLDRAERIVAGQSQQEQRTAEIFLRPTEGEA